MTDSDQVRYAVVGLGQGLLDAYVALRHPRFRLVAVCDADPAAHRWITGDDPIDETATDRTGQAFRVDWLRCIRKVPDRKHVEYVPDYAELLARDDIDAVAIVVPNAAHEPLTIQALEAGKYVLGTKPMSDTVDSAIRIAEAARHHRCRYMLGFQLTYSPFTQIIEQIVHSGALGELRQLRFDYHRDPWPSHRRRKDTDERLIDVPGYTLPHEFHIGYYQMYDEFARMCLDGKEPYSNWKTVLENMLTCHAAQTAVAENRTVHRSEVRDVDLREEDA